MKVVFEARCTPHIVSGGRFVAEFWVRSHGGRSGTGTGLSPSTLVFRCQTFTAVVRVTTVGTFEHITAF